MEHAYTPLVVHRDEAEPSDMVLDKAESRMAEGVEVVYKGTTGGVAHFEVASASGQGIRRVEYDIARRSFRCSCWWGYYAGERDPEGHKPCHHIQMVSDSIPWGEISQ